ncbi:MAG TPA: hypothetical protein VJU86_01530 [Pyrinomonadaceae bacterium]|nr:hypothetical protein [Pyrinomonadaceae bacterium]
MDDVREINDDHELLNVLGLTRSGLWEPIATIHVNNREIVERYRTPLIVKLGYTHSFQSDIPQRPG